MSDNGEKVGYSNTRIYSNERTHKMLEQEEPKARIAVIRGVLREEFMKRGKVQHFKCDNLAERIEKAIRKWERPESAIA